MAQWNEEPITTTNNSIDIKAEGLTPETVYYVYFVMKSATGQQLSKVWVYQFETTPVINPQIVINRGDSSATFGINNKQPTYLDYIVYTTQNLPEFFNRMMSNTKNTSATEAPYIDVDNYVQDGMPSTYENRTLIEAMMDRYTYKSGDDPKFKKYDGYSLFDAFASDDVKRVAADLIRQSNANGGTLGGFTTMGDTGNRLLQPPYSTPQTFDIAANMQYYILAVGHHSAVHGTEYEVAQFDSFGARDAISKVDQTPPKYGWTDGMDLGTKIFDTEKEALEYEWSGELGVNFDKPIYQSIVEGKTRNVYAINPSKNNYKGETQVGDITGPDDGDSKSVLNVITKTASLVVDTNVSGKYAAANFRLAYSKAKDKNSITFVKGNIANMDGIYTEKGQDTGYLLTLTFHVDIEKVEESKIDKNQSGMEIVITETHWKAHAYWTDEWRMA